MDQASLQLFRDVSTRLNPLRRFLTDIETAAKSATQVYQIQQELAETVEVLLTQKQGLEAEVADLSDQKAMASGQLEATLVAIDDQVNAKQAAARAVLDDLQAQVAEAQSVAQEKLTRIHTGYDQELQRLQAETERDKAELAAALDALREISLRLKTVA